MATDREEPTQSNHPLPGAPVETGTTPAGKGSVDNAPIVPPPPGAPRLFITLLSPGRFVAQGGSMKQKTDAGGRPRTDDR